MLTDKHLKPIKGGALFYPCCGTDYATPLRLFRSAIRDFYFVDVNEQQDALPKSSESPAGVNHQVHCLTGNAEDVFQKLPNLAVFFHRRDSLEPGEGSSGIPWLGSEWLERILSKLVRGGFVVTDGSNRTPDGPPELSRFHDDPHVTADAVSKAKIFTFAGRDFSCVDYAGQGYGPTLIWKVD
jgi:hypothetical protein